MSRSAHQCPPRRINNPSPRPSDASSGEVALERLARLLGRQEAKAEHERPAYSIGHATGGSFNE